MALTRTQAQFDKRIESVTHIRPVFMSRDEFESLLRRKLLDVAEGAILTDADDFMVIRGMGQMGALELLMKIGLILSELDIPSAGQDNEDVLTQEKQEKHE